MATNQRQTNAAKSGKKGQKNNKRKMIIFGVEVVIILIMIGVLYLVLRTPAGKGPQVTTLDPEKLEIAEEIIQAKEEDPENKMRGYMNIALFGVDVMTDNPKALMKGNRSDSTMIASINLDTGDIKLVSVYRDTYLNVGKNDQGKISYEKCNAAYSYGGAEQAVQMLNMNLDMDIENFVTVGYKGLIEAIDGLGGVYIDVDSEELKHINNYQFSIAEVLKCEYEPVKETGYLLLNGMQATAYCRIRQTAGDDFKRASRQREVIKQLESRAKATDLATLTKVFNECIDDVYTSLDPEDILELLKNIANYRIVDEGGFPEQSMWLNANMGAKGACIIPNSLEDNVIWLHQFLFDDETYAVTETVKKHNDKIVSDTSAYIQK